MANKKVEMTVEQKENGQYVEHIAYPFVEYDHVTMENGMDIMSMIRDDVSTPMVTHNTTSWKVGQGDGDVSESIVDSSVGDMTIKGQTYQNILPSPTLRNSMTDGNTMQKINEGYDSVEVVDGNVKSAILKGQTLVNLMPRLEGGNYYTNGLNSVNLESNEYKVYHSTTANNCIRIRRGDLETKLKQNTDYTLIVKITESTITNQNIKLGISTHGNLSCIDGTNYISSNRIDLGNTIGFFKEKIRLKEIPTPNRTSDIYFCFWDGTGNDTEYVKFKVMIIEGDYTNVDTPYFEGMQSVKMPVLTTTNKIDGISKGLITMSGKITDVIDNANFTIKTNGVRWTGANSSMFFTQDMNSEFGTKYVIEFDGKLLKGDLDNAFGVRLAQWSDFVEGYDRIIPTNGKYRAVIKSGTNPENNRKTSFNICTTDTNTIAKDVEYQIRNLRVYPVNDNDEPYKSNILSCNEEVTLRGIGEVKDTLDGDTGELTNRLGYTEHLLQDLFNFSTVFGRGISYQEASDRWVGLHNGINHAYFNTMLPLNFSTTNDVNSNVSIYKVNSDWFGIAIKSSELVSKGYEATADGLLDYAKNEKMICTYKLPNKVIKTVDLTILDQDNQPVAQLNSFANGYIQVSSQEGTLTPTTEYEVPTSNSYHADLIKPNAQYTMKNMQGTFTIDGVQYNASVNGTFTSPSTLSNRLMITNVVQTQPMLLEGDMTSKEVPYVEGIKSTFEGVDKVEIISQNAANSLSNTTSFQLSNPLRSLPNSVRDEIVLDRVNHKAKIIQRVGEDLTQLDTPIVTEVNLEGYPYVYKDGRISLNTEIAPTTEVTYSINQAHQIESSNEDILRHQKEVNQLYELIAQYVQVQYETELIDIALQG